MSDIFCYDGTTCRVSDEVQELRERVRTLEAQLAAVTQDEQINTIEALRKLRVLLSDDGGYGIGRRDGEKMGLGELITIGNLFEAIDKWLDMQPHPAVQP